MASVICTSGNFLAAPLPMGGGSSPVAPSAPTITSVVGAGGSVTNGGTTTDTSFTVNTSITGSGAVAGDLLRLFDGGVQTGADYTLTGTDITNNTAAGTTGTLSVAAHALTAQLIHSGAASVASNTWSFTITASMTPATWDPANANARVAFSNGNKTATAGPTSSEQPGFATLGESTGKFYFEVTNTVAAPGLNAVGVGDSTMPITDNSFPGTSSHSAACYLDTGQIFSNNVVAATIAGLAQGDTLGVAYDTDANLVWMRSTVSALWNGAAIGVADPAAGIGGIAISSSGAIFPIYGIAASGSVTINCGGSAYALTPPVGFNNVAS